MDKENIIFFLWVGFLILVAAWIPNRHEISAWIRASRADAAVAKQPVPLVIIKSTLLSCSAATDCAGDGGVDCEVVPDCINNLCVYECPVGTEGSK